MKKNIQAQKQSLQQAKAKELAAMAVEELKTQDLKSKLKERWEAKKAEAAVAPKVEQVVAQPDAAPKQKRASLSTIIAKQSNTQSDAIKTITEAQNNDIVESLSKTVKVPKLAKANSQKDATPVHQSSTHDAHDLKSDDLKGVVGGELSNLVEESTD